jgi:hypothetical protein
MKVFENVVHWQKWRWDIRVWCERTENGPDAFQHLATLTACLKELPEPWSDNPMDVAKDLLLVMTDHGVKVNALEVKIDNWGSIIYPDWP